MRYLLDTHLVLWAARDDDRLPAHVRELLIDPTYEFVVSTVSIWEVSIKASLGRADFAVDARQLRRALLANGYEELGITGEHAEGLAQLPGINRDPFDRMLVAQARVESFRLLTADARLAQYGEPVELV